MPITLEIQRELIEGLVPLSLHVAWRRSREGVPFAEVLKAHVNLYRLTALYDGKVMPYNAPSGWRDDAWETLLHHVRVIYERHAAAPTSEAFEREGYALLWPVLEPALARAVAQWPRLEDRPYGFFSYNLKDLPQASGRAIELHLENPFAPVSPFADPEARRCELRRLLADVTAAHPEVTHVTTGTWLNSLKPFLALFPPEWAASATLSTAPFLAGNHWWGQFYDRRGGFNRKNAEHLRVTGEFPYPPMDCQCRIDSVLASTVRNGVSVRNPP